MRVACWVFALAMAFCSGAAFAQEAAIDVSDPALSKRPMVKAKSIRVDYPTSALRKGIEGDVTVLACIDARGKVTSLELTTSSGSVALDRQTMDMLKKADFDPGEVGGVKIAVCGYNFLFQWRLPP